MSMDKFDVDIFHKLLQSSKVGRKLVYTEVTGSTMDDAMHLARDVTVYPHGTVILSEQQTKARGSHDHKWDATNTGNIYASIVLHMPQKNKTFEGSFDVEVAACLAVFQVVRKFGVTNVVPKWPNDLWVKGHKLAGFLEEDGQFDIPGTTNCLRILGMGINVNADVRRSNQLQSVATSMVCERGGQYVNREKFLAEVCLILEQMLANNRKENFTIFLKENLFQENCQISVSHHFSEKVLDGIFISICNNWDVKFLDIENGEIMQGSSEVYSIRPKVINKILIIFASTHSSKITNSMSQWITSVIDTSKYIVCLAAQSTLTSTDEWMTNCSLLVLLEDVSDTAFVTRKLDLYLKSGGSIMACGRGALYLANVLGVQVKDAVVGTSDRTFVLLHLETEIMSNLSALDNDESTCHCNSHAIPATSSTKLSDDTGMQTSVLSVDKSQTVIFPADPICCHVYDIDNSICVSSDVEDKLYLVNQSVCQSLNSNSIHNHHTEVKAYFRSAGDQEKMLSVFAGNIKCGGKVALWGFNIVILSEDDYVYARDVAQTVKQDRFKRDDFLQKLLEALLKS